jgi:hypothetical protein
MDAVTYPNPQVVQLIREKFLPVRIQHNRDLGGRFSIKWTPTVVLLDTKGTEAYRTVGFLPPEHLISSLTFGLGEVNLQEGKYENALSYFNKVASTFPGSEEAPAAIYYAGVTRFKITDDPTTMKEAYETLSVRYPDSSWAKKAVPYSLTQ